MSQPIKLDDIRFAGILTRVKLDRSAVEDYRERWENGSEPPEIIVYHDPTADEFCYWLADGWHRYSAARALEMEVINADVRRGTRRDAIECSIKSNWSHGVRRSNADKRKAVELALEDATWGEWSNRQVAQFCGVSDTFVADVRQTLTPSTAVKPQLTDGTLVGADGRRRRARRKPTQESPQPVATSPVTSGSRVPRNGVKPSAIDSRLEFDPAKLEKQSKAKNGRPEISRKVRSLAHKSLGELIRALQEMGIYETHADALNSIAEHLKNV